MEIKLPLLIHVEPTKEWLRSLGYEGHALKIAAKCARNIWLRTRLAEAQNWHCAWCGRICTEHKGKSNSITIEHVTPRSKGGPDEWENMVMACHACNNNRGTHSVEHFLASRQYHSPEGNKARREQKKFEGYMKRMDKMFDRGADLEEWLRSVRIRKDYMKQLIAKKEALLACQA